MAYVIKPYDDSLNLILEKGTWKSNKRTGIKCLSYFGILNRYRIDEHFPLLTKRKVWPKSIFAELLWIISGSTNVYDLEKLGSTIWAPWRDEEFEKKNGYAPGCLGPVYGFQLRHFGGDYGNGVGGYNKIWVDHQRIESGLPEQESYDDYVVSAHRPSPTKISGYGACGFDQLTYMVNRIKEDPSCRRILFSLWNPKQLGQMRLPPCHYTYQVFIDDEGKLSGMLTQRSCDFPIGVPANIQFYSALTIILAQQTGYQPYEFIHSTADSHIYENQIDAVKEYLSRSTPDSPRVNIKKAKDIFSYQMDDFEVIDYNPNPPIKIPVAV